MTPPRPPLLATWMCRGLTAAAWRHSEAFEGDLLEAWREGRSNAWYWRQILVAVSPVSSITESRLVRLAAAVAVLTITALGALLTITLGVVLAIRENRWWPLMSMIVGLLAGFLPLGIALHRRRSSG